MNYSNGSIEEPPPAGFNTLQTTVLTVLYSITILVSLIGNVLLIHIVKRKPDTRTLTGFLFVNMAVADLLVTFIVMPLVTAWLYTDGLKWLPGILGLVSCTFMYYISYVTIVASVVSLMLISVDRYLAVAFPLRRFPRFRQTKVLTVAIWLSSMIISIPAAFIWRFEKNELLGEFNCAANFLKLGIGDLGMKVFYMYLFLLVYLIPLITISSLYILTARSLWFRQFPGIQRSNQCQQRTEMTKRKVVRTLIIITAVFALCWLPTQCYHIILAFFSDIHDKATFPLYVMSLCFWLGHANSAINPWLYMLLSDNFRKALCDVVVHRGRYSRHGPRHSGARSSLQRSKLRPFWSPWRVEKIFGDRNSRESRQLATNMLKEKLT